MQGSKVYVNTSGLMVLVRVNAVLVNAVTLKFLVRRPDGLEVEWSANAVVADESGLLVNMAYVTVPGDLNMVGEYIIQPFVAYSHGFSGKGTPIRLRVWPKWR